MMRAVRPVLVFAFGAAAGYVGWHLGDPWGAVPWALLSLRECFESPSRKAWQRLAALEAELSRNGRELVALEASVGHPTREQLRELEVGVSNLVPWKLETAHTPNAPDHPVMSNFEPVVTDDPAYLRPANDSPSRIRRG